MTEHDPNASAILVGGPEEAALNEKLRRQYPSLLHGGGGYTIEEFAGTIAHADWVLTSDSLGYHVACAVGTPAICLVGPTSPWELDTYGENSVLHPALNCIACYHATCPLSITCMDVLTPEMVWEHILRWRTPGRTPSGVLAVPTESAVRSRRLPLLVAEQSLQQLG
jgi:ADP-heptose:LPS heptosyltransferase